MKNTDKASMDNRSNQMNQNYQGHTSGYSGTGTKSDLNNHSNQLNPNSGKFGGKK